MILIKKPFPKESTTDQQPPAWVSSALGFLILWITGWGRMGLSGIASGYWLGWFSLISAGPVSQELGPGSLHTACPSPDGLPCSLPSERQFTPGLPESLPHHHHCGYIVTVLSICLLGPCFGYHSSLSLCWARQFTSWQERGGLWVTGLEVRLSALHGFCHLNEIFLSAGLSPIFNLVFVLAASSSQWYNYSTWN